MNKLPCLLISLCLAFTLQGFPQGAKTPDEIEKVHSRLFHKGPAGHIPDMLSKGNGDVYLTCAVGVVQKLQVSPQEELQMLASDSDLVVLAKAGAATTNITADKDFLYTDWKFTVEEVLKNNVSSPTKAGATILVTRPGGKLQINGRMLHADCADFLHFSAGQEYLLYLRYVPETGAYSIATGARAFLVSPTVKRLDAVNTWSEQSNNRNILLKVARDAVAASAPRGSEGLQ